MARCPRKSHYATCVMQTATGIFLADRETASASPLGRPTCRRRNSASRAQDALHPKCKLPLPAWPPWPCLPPKPIFASESNAWGLLGDGQRCAADVAVFVDRALGMLD